MILSQSRLRIPRLNSGWTWPSSKRLRRSGRVRLSGIAAQALRSLADAADRVQAAEHRAEAQPVLIGFGVEVRPPILGK